MAKFGHVNSTVLCKIFQQYCCSLYGVLLCSLDGRYVNDLFTEWRKAVRRICRLPPRTHNVLLPNLVNSVSLDISLEKRMYNFFMSMLRSENTIVQSIAKRGLYQSYSIMGQNITKLRLKYENKYDLFNGSSEELFTNVYKEWFIQLAYETTVSGILKELIDARDKLTCINVLWESDICSLLLDICIH